MYIIYFKYFALRPVLDGIDVCIFFLPRVHSIGIWQCGVPVARSALMYHPRERGCTNVNVSVDWFSSFIRIPKHNRG